MQQRYLFYSKVFSRVLCGPRKLHSYRSDLLCISSKSKLLIFYLCLVWVLLSEAGKVQVLHCTFPLPDSHSGYYFEKAILKNLQIAGLAFHTQALQNSSREDWKVLGNVKRNLKTFTCWIEIVTFSFNVIPLNLQPWLRYGVRIKET